MAGRQFRKTGSNTKKMKPAPEHKSQLCNSLEKASAAYVVRSKSETALAPLGSYEN